LPRPDIGHAAAAAAMDRDQHLGSARANAAALDRLQRAAVALHAVRRGAGLPGHWCRIGREDDAAPLADVFTLRQF
jgi:hypothetical protein